MKKTIKDIEGMFKEKFKAFERLHERGVVYFPLQTGITHGDYYIKLEIEDKVILKEADEFRIESDYGNLYTGHVPNHDFEKHPDSLARYENISLRFVMTETESYNNHTIYAYKDFRMGVMNHKEKTDIILSHINDKLKKQVVDYLQEYDKHVIEFHRLTKILKRVRDEF